MTQEEADRRQIEHWREAHQTNKTLVWMAGTFGVCLLGIATAAGVALKSIAVNENEIAALRTADAGFARADIAIEQKISSAVADLKLARFEIQQATAALLRLDEENRR